MKPIKYIVCLLGLLMPLWVSAQSETTDSLHINYVFKLYGQTRRYAMTLSETDAGGVQIDWTIFSYQKWLKGSYLISPAGLRSGTQLNFKQPQNGNIEKLTDRETFGLLSLSAFDSLTQTGEFVYSNTTYRLQEKQRMAMGDKVLDVFYVVADMDETEMWIWNNPKLPLICRIEKNPLKIDFFIEKMEP